MNTLLQKVKDLKFQVDTPELYWDRNIIIASHIHPNGRTVAKYIFVLCNAGSFKTNILVDDTPLQHLVEDLFYELRDDLGWNLYLVCVMGPDEFVKISLEDRLLFQNNREFTRNLIIPITHLEKEIPVGKVLLDDMDDTLEDPVDIWNQSLMESGLSFCLEDYSNANIQNYIEGRITEYSGGMESVSTPDIPVINRIDSLNMTKSYRPHCFGVDNTLEFSQVNLLSGANGTGKTSVLQAIELVVTGEIRTGKGSPSSEETTSGLSIGYNGGDTLSIPANTDEKRRRESSWYLNRDATRTKPALNNVFHVYNTFTVEDTFLFSFDGLQPAYEDFFTKMLFGEEVKKAERCWKKSKDAFATHMKELQSQLQQTNERLTALLSPDPVSRETILQYLNNLHIRYNPNSSIDDIRNIVIELQTRCDSVASLPPITTRHQLDIARNALNELQSSLNAELDDLEEEKNTISGTLDQDRDRLEEATAIQSQINQEKAKYHYALSQYNSLQFINNQYDLLMKLRAKKAESEEVQTKANIYTSFLSHYKELASWTVDISELTISSEKLQQIKLELPKLQADTKDCWDRIERLQSEKKGIEDTIAQLKTYGKIYVESIKDFHGCPLCGNQKITLEDFRNHLNLEADEMNQELIAAHKTLRETEGNLVAKVSEATSLEKAVEQLNIISEAYAVCIQTLGVEPTQYSDKLSLIQATIQMGHAQQALLASLHDEVRILDIELHSTIPEILLPIYNSGEYEEMVSTLEHSINIREADQKPLNERIADLLGNLRTKQDYWNSREALIDNQVRELTALIKTVEEQLEKLQEQIQNIRTQISAQMECGNEHEKINEFFNDVSILLHEDVEEIDARALSGQCASLVLMMNSFLQQQQNATQIEQLGEAVKGFTQRIDRAQNAIDQLSMLTESHVFAQGFIEHHINRISEIFGSLHMPKEFDRLVLHKGQITGVRESAFIPIKQMSTGQKTAVALSVFLTLNSAMKTSPQFILIDEPVSNIDDLNILSLLDFLREMVISYGKQIFFTTANYNVKKLFRRKFSFLEHGLSEYCFERSTNLKTNVTVKRYNQREMTEKKVISFSS